MIHEHERIPASELCVGDLVAVDGGLVEVLQEPQIGHRGWSVFDEFEVIVVVRVRAVAAGAESRYVTWRHEDAVWRLGRDRRRT